MSLQTLVLNLQRSSAINTAVYGNFSAPKAQEIVVARGNVLELLRPDDTGKVLTICATPVFAVIRSLHPFRLVGSNRDYVVIGSDSGKISIVEFDTAKNEWKSVHNEVFGKTGCRRIVPGQYLAIDPKGRAIMIAGIEKQKFVYVMNRDSANRLTISSPLEAHKSETILFSVVGVDVGFENPIFAMIELDYSEADQDPTGEAVAATDKRLTYYELDLGLNHVIRKWSEPISRTANFLLPVPGGDDGPSGVLICGENWISYKHMNHPEIRTVIPRRSGLPAERGTLLVTGTLHKQKDLFFFMVQSEYGDVYKVTLTLNPTDNKLVTNLVCALFDTLQLCNSLCITKTGLLFAASEFGNHSLFQFQGLGDDLQIRSEKVSDELNESLGDDSVSAASIAPQFEPNPKLQNLALIDDMNSLAPVTDMLVDDLAGEESPQIHVLCGRGNRSSLRILRHGVSVTEVAVSDLPGKATAVWTVKRSVDSPFDRYIVVSFSHATLTLSIGDTVEEVTDSGFNATGSTLLVTLMADNSLLQVQTNGIYHIRPGKPTQVEKFRRIEKATSNGRQVAISEDGGQIHLFELDETGSLFRLYDDAYEIGKEVSSLDFGDIPPGRIRSPFLAVGTWEDAVYIFSTDPQETSLTQLSFKALPSRPESVCLVDMSSTSPSSSSPSSSSSSSSASSASSTSQLYLNVGLVSGVFIRLSLDPNTGAMLESRQRFLGPKAVKVFRVKAGGSTGVLAITTRPWLSYTYQGKYFQAPVTYEALDFAAGFGSELCPEGIVGVSGNTLRIITVDSLGSVFNQVSFPLRYTPRKMARLPGSRMLVIVEADHNEFNEAERATLPQSSSNSIKHGSDSGGGAGEMEDDEEATIIPVRGPVPAADGKWASCIRLHSCESSSTTDLVELSDNEAALTVCSCRFVQTHADEVFICVGAVQNMKLHPRSVQAGYIYVYRVIDKKLSLVHKTEIEDAPMAMMEFQGKLIVGIGRCLRMYDLGKRKLLRKCENRLFPTCIARLSAMGDRIFVGDVCESMHYVKYRRQDNTLSIFADDVVPRFITCISNTPLDYATVCCGDKFGNVFTLTLPPEADDDVESNSSTRMLWDQGVLNGAPNKLDNPTHYFLGEVVTSIQKCNLVVGGPEVLLLATVSGGIYAILPFSSRDDASFYQHVEMFLRQESPSLCGRDHMSYRSYFQPVRMTVDGDLCDRFASLPSAKQKEFADEVDRTVAEIVKKLEETKNIL